MISYTAITRIGDRKRNEDSTLCAERGGRYCFAVADGLGGHGKGDIASRILTGAFESALNGGPSDTGAFLAEAFDSAQDTIISAQKASHATLEMKTTAVALAIFEGRCRWGHIGDSRLYLFEKNKARTRTLDHSVAQMLAITKDIKERDIARHPDRNRLLRALGIEWGSSRYELSDERDISDCQAFLLCSDGFWEWIEEKKMQACLKKSLSVDEWLSFMAKEVECNGKGKDMDNYSAVAVFC